MSVNRIDVAVPPPAVWDVLCDGWTYSNWVVGASHVRAVDSRWPAVGTKVFHASGVWPAVARDETVVDECEPGRRLVLTASARPFGAARVILELTPTDAGTEVTITEEPSGGPGRWFHNPLSELALSRRNVETLARLRAIAERRTTP